MNFYQTTTPIERFAAYIIGKPLYPYQADVANAIIYSIDHNLGHIITVMMARQSGKNQLSAIIEAFLLFSRREGTIIKAAPTFSPQIINSRRRLMSMLDNPFCKQRVWTSYAQIGLAPTKDRRAIRQHSGPSTLFFSADPDSLLLEIDKAQTGAGGACLFSASMTCSGTTAPQQVQRAALQGDVESQLRLQ